MKRKLWIVLAVVVFLSSVALLLIHGTASAARIILFPGKGHWYICQGYNTPEISHTGRDIYAFDLSISSKSIGGGYGCSSSTAYVSKGQRIYSPAKGTIISSPSGHPDILQIKLNSGGCFRVAHLTTALKVGNSVYQGQFLGTLSAPNSLNGNYSHLHISAYSDSNCNNPVPFTSSNGFRLEGAPDFPASGAKHQYRGSSITQDYPAQSMNLNAYCIAKGHTGGATLIGNTVYDWRCKKSDGSLIGIAMTDVCTWQFQGLLDYPKFTNVNDPGSWKCYIKP